MPIDIGVTQMSDNTSLALAINLAEISVHPAEALAALERLCGSWET